MTFHFPSQTGFYQGKVRDVYRIGKDRLAMVVSDRISAFDTVLPRPIPHKGAVLNGIAAQMLDATEDIVPNWKRAVPAPQITVGIACTPYPVEMVVRGHLTGHAWRTYAAGGRLLCGVPLPGGMKENEAFEQPILTPTTKASEGHDEDISREEIIAQGIVPAAEYEQLEKYALALFARGQALAGARGLILVDTKYEFGRQNETIYLIDEIHTPDSSRYFYAEGFEDRVQRGEPQRQLSKEFVREWLMAGGFQGQEGQQVPEMTNEVVAEISKRYQELYQLITGAAFVPQDLTAEEVFRRTSGALEAKF